MKKNKKQDENEKLLKKLLALQDLHGKEILIDVTGTGKIIDWSKDKTKNLKIADVYDDSIDKNKAIRLRDCSSYMIYKRASDSGVKKLINGNFCRVRLCNICQKRRALKIYSQVRSIMEHMAIDCAAEKKERYKFIFVTLTVQNCNPDKLMNGLDELMKGFKRLMDYDRVKKSIKGWYRGLEITHDTNVRITSKMYNDPKRKKYYDDRGLFTGDINPNYNTYHCHFHMCCAVNKSYFVSRDYIKQEEWTALWKQAMQLKYEPVVDVRAVKGNTAKSVCEIAKYTVKDNDYLIKDKKKLTHETVELLNGALHKRRLVAFGGVMKEYQKKLKLDDIEKGSYENIDSEAADEMLDKGFELVTYAFNTGLSNYFRYN